MRRPRSLRGRVALWMVAAAALSLALFLRRKGELLRREDILLQVFGYNFEPGTNLVNVHIANLRKKLRGSPIVIDAVRGVGYRLRPSEGPDGGDHA